MRARQVAGFVVGPVGRLYACGAGLHRALHATGLLPVEKLGCRVLSVGGLTLGGAGKTPMAAWLAASLHERGHRVVLATRGYGRARSEPVTVVSDGHTLLADPARAGDEPVVLAAHAPGVPVLAGPRRAVVGRHAIAELGCEVMILDDGFQHHGLARDLDLVCIDGQQGLAGGRVVPAGALRESPSALTRADAIGVIDGPLCAADSQRIDAFAAGALRFAARRRPRSIHALAGGQGFEPALLRGQRVGVLTALARPESFERSLGELGAEIVARRHFRDHHRYRARDLRPLRARAPIWVTSEKDAVKILPSWLAGLDLRVLCMDLEVDQPARLLDWVEARLGLSGAAVANRRARDRESASSPAQ